MKYHIPRIMLAAPASGCGKTAITCGLLQALLDRGCAPSAFKCGPDYIDPMFHKYVLGVNGGNLDSFFLGEEDICRQLAEGVPKNSPSREIAVVEGVMGYFDGVAGISTRASSFDIARITETPVILIADCRGASLSAAAVIQGFLQYERDRISESGAKDAGALETAPGNQIKGVLLNRISPAMAERLKPEIERLGVTVVGVIPECPEMKLASRHLGLVRPEEITLLHTQMKQLAEKIEMTVEIDRICEIAQSAPELVIEDVPDKSLRSNVWDAEPRLRIAVARDRAFCFYYQENLRLLESMGAELVIFSPIEDSGLPADIDGMLLGGGYPELYASELSSNIAMKAAVKAAITSGMPYLAECGGFLYLHRELEASDGVSYPMTGVIDGAGYRTEHLSRFGYISLAPVKQDQCLNHEIKGHEFHYWDSTNGGDDWKASKPLNSRNWSCVHSRDYQIAGFPHLYYPSNPAFVKNWLDGCRMYRDRRKRETIADISLKQQRPGTMGRVEVSMKQEEQLTLLEEQLARVQGLDQTSCAQAQARWNQIAKPLGSLGLLESAVVKIAGIQEKSQIEIGKKALIIMCADNGVVEEGVSQTGQEVTAVVTENFTKGDSCVCIMAERAGVDVVPVDIGVAGDLDHCGSKYPLIRRTIARGTRNFRKEPAMTREETVLALQTGMAMVKQLKDQGYQLIATGEMGIGNTTTSSAVASVLTGMPPARMTGKGAGLSDEGLKLKIQVIEEALDRYWPCRATGDSPAAIEVLSNVGGLDIAGLAGVFLGGAVYKIPIIIDGFISSTAALAARSICPKAADYMLASHVSAEPAGRLILDCLALSPLIAANMCLGEGTGAIAIVPLLDMAAGIYSRMSTFKEIQIEDYRPL